MAGLGTLIRLILRRDRLKLPLALGLVCATLIAMVPLLQNVYGDVASLQSMYQSFSANPAMLFMTGPIDGPTFGALVTIETLLWWGMAIAFINTLFVVRHTRHNEEIGAQELLLSGRVHRWTSLVAAMIVAVGMNTFVAVALGFGMQVSGATWGADQAWLFGLAMGGLGLAWAGVGAVVVQLVESGRTANGLLAALIGAGFILRGIGDFLGSIGSSGLHEPLWVSFLSPFGWLQLTRPLTDPHWWPLVLPVVFWVVMIGVGLVLLAHRDVGEGVVPSRAGRARASRLLATPVGLAWKLQRNIFMGWFVGVLVMTATIGALVPQMTQVLSTSEAIGQVIRQIGGADALVPAFMAAMIGIMSVLVFAYTLHGLGRLRSEESSGHLESLLATRLSRLRWLGTHLAIIVAGGALMLAASGAGLGLLINQLSDLQVQMSEYAAASLSYLPAMAALMALYLVLFGLVPRIAGLITWLYFGFVAFVLWLGPMVQLDQALMNLSVMEHIASAPAEAVAWKPLAVMTMASVAVAVVGVIVFCQRNLKTA